MNPLRVAARAVHQRFLEVTRDRHYYVSRREARRRRGQYRDLRYTILSVDDLKHRRTSDTLFILGSGPSLLTLTDTQWRDVAAADSFGINFSFLLDFVPTFHLMEDGKDDWVRQTLRKTLEPRRKRLHPTVWCIGERQPGRRIHPAIAPELFPEEPTVCIRRDARRGIELAEDRPFRASDFAKTVVYRGTMSLILQLALGMGYRRIVLLGVDLHVFAHFYDDMPEMADFVARTTRDLQTRLNVTTIPKFPSMVPIGRKHRPFDEYLYAVNELHLRPRGDELYVGSADSMLHPRIPLYPKWSDR